MDFKYNIGDTVLMYTNKKKFITGRTDIYKQVGCQYSVFRKLPWTEGHVYFIENQIKGIIRMVLIEKYIEKKWNREYTTQ